MVYYNYMNLNFTYLFNLSVERVKKYFVPLVILSLLLILIQVILELISKQKTISDYIIKNIFQGDTGKFDILGPFVIGLFVSFISLPISAIHENAYVMAIKEEGKIVNFNFNILNVILGSILATIMICFGLIAFIIPGIYLMVRLLPYIPVIINENLNPIEAITRSFELTADNEADLFYNGLRIFGMLTLIVFTIFIVMTIASLSFGFSGNEMLTNSIIELLLVIPGLVAGILPATTYFELLKPKEV
jgi:uncharacterized membrane protein